MEAARYFFPGGGDGGGGSTGVSTNESIVCEAERMHQGPSGEESSFSGEAELELGLGLSIGGGCGTVKPGGRTERGRILTAKDFPSAVFNEGFSSSSSCSSSPAPIRVSPSPSLSPAVAVSGTKRAAEPVSLEGGSPSGSSQVVGWPPIRTYRMNSFVNQTKASIRKSEDDLKKKKKKKKKNRDPAEGTAKPGFVKVSMDGAVIGRKLDLNSHSSYLSLSQAVHDMFFSPASSVITNGAGGDEEEAKKISRLTDGTGAFVLTYEDGDGDWMLAGDVPWRMFVGSVKKLRIMRTSDANGLCTQIKVIPSFSTSA